MGAGGTACELAALLTERDVLTRHDGVPEADIRTRLDLLRGVTIRHDVDQQALKRVRLEREELPGRPGPNGERRSPARVRLSGPDRPATSGTAGEIPAEERNRRGHGPADARPRGIHRRRRVGGKDQREPDRSGRADLTGRDRGALRGRGRERRRGGVGCRSPSGHCAQTSAPGRRDSAGIRSGPARAGQGARRAYRGAETGRAGAASAGAKRRSDSGSV